MDCASPSKSRLSAPLIFSQALTLYATPVVYLIWTASVCGCVRYGSAPALKRGADQTRLRAMTRLSLRGSLAMVSSQGPLRAGDRAVTWAVCAFLRPKQSLIREERWPKGVENREIAADE